MRLRWAAALVLAGCTDGLTAAPVADPLDDAWETALKVSARLKREVDCFDKVSGFLCYATRLPGVEHPLPEARRTYLGLTSLVRSSRAIPDGTTETLMTTEMTIEPEGVWLSTIRPDTDEARGWYIPVVSTVAKSLRGEMTEIEITPELKDWFSEPLPGHHKIDRDEHGYKFQGARATRLVYVPAEGSEASAWVMFEHQPGGTFVTVFPDVPMVVH